MLFHPSWFCIIMHPQAFPRFLVTGGCTTMKMLRYPCRTCIQVASHHFSSWSSAVCISSYQLLSFPTSSTSRQQVTLNNIFTVPSLVSTGMVIFHLRSHLTANTHRTMNDFHLHCSTMIVPVTQEPTGTSHAYLAVGAWH